MYIYIYDNQNDNLRRMIIWSNMYIYNEEKYGHYLKGLKHI